ncbi:MAG TPA: energy-coupling factor transporter transmembrane component T [Chloroflexota bacterium]|nr:energy-coupling factor transporter transmembrane component T [Chloroflexota bacterium]
MAEPYLRRRNPTIKLAVALVLSIALTLVIDPVTPLLVLCLTLAAGLTLGRIRLGTYARALLPLVLVALGFVWSNAAFANVPAGSDTIAQFGPIRLTWPGLVFGLAIALRGLAIGALSVTFILSTDPTDLVVSLVRHGRLPFRIGYALMAGLRFLPFFTAEFEQIRLAQRVRGQVESNMLPARLKRRFSYLIPLLSSAVRRASRVAIAMDSRGFAAVQERTYYRVVPLTWRDLMFAAACLGAMAVILATGASGGWLRLWDGRFAA